MSIKIFEIEIGIAPPTITRHSILRKTVTPESHQPRNTPHHFDFDTDPSTGSNAIPAGLTQPERVKGMAAMKFDTVFTPDKAISLGINSGRTEVSIFDPFQLIVNERFGEAGDVIAFNDNNTAATPADATTGFECYLDYDTIYDGLTPDPGIGIRPEWHLHKGW